MSVQKQGMPKLFEQAIFWISANGDAPMPMPSPQSKPGTPGGQSSSNYDESWELFYSTRRVDSRLLANGDVIWQMPLRCIPLFAAIQQELPTKYLSKIICRHGVSLDDIRSLSLEPQKVIFTNKHGEDVTFLDIHISIWKAFDELGMIDRPDLYSKAEFVAAMHTGVKEAWPVTVMEQDIGIVEGSWNDWGLTDVRQLPNNDPILFLERAGMLSKPLINAGRQSLVFWGDFCLSAAKGGELAEYVLKACTGPIPGTVKQAIRMGLASMDASETKWGVMKPYLAGIFAETDLADILNSHILNFNMGGPSQLTDVIIDDSILDRFGAEALTRPPEYMGETFFSAFSTLSIYTIPPQKLESVSPEALILHIDKGLQAMLCGKEEFDMPYLFEPGFRGAFEMLGRNHQWDYAAFQTCSSLGQKLMVEAGANVRSFPGMNKRHRGLILEQELGL